MSSGPPGGLYDRSGNSTADPGGDRSAYPIVPKLCRPRLARVDDGRAAAPGSAARCRLPIRSPGCRPNGSSPKLYYWISIVLIEMKPSRGRPVKRELTRERRARANFPSATQKAERPQGLCLQSDCRQFVQRLMLRPDRRRIFACYPAKMPSPTLLSSARSNSARIFSLSSR